MAMVIGTNVASITAQRHLESSRISMETSMERLASGNRINSAMDDAAGLAITHRLDAKITGLNQGVRNANDGISMLQTAEGALEQTNEILNRMKEIATQASSGTYSAADRTALNTEFQALATEITRISDNTDFNGTDLLKSATAVTFVVGDTGTDTIAVTLAGMDAVDLALTGADVITTTAASAITTENGAAAKQAGTFTMAASVAAGEYLEINVNGSAFKQLFDTDSLTTYTLLANKINNGTSDLNATAADKVLTITSTVNNTPWSATALKEYTVGAGSASLTTAANAIAAMSKVDTAIDTVDAFRSTLGATSNRLEHTIDNLMNRSENQAAARSRIEDANFAAESANLAKTQVLQQAGTAMLAQANASTQNVLSLLK